LIPLLLALSCGGQEIVPAEVLVEAQPGLPDLVLTLVTGLRDDAGSDADEAFLTATGVTGRRFSTAYAQSPSPFASLGSMLTGRYVGAIPMCGLMLAGDRVHRDDQQPWCAGIPGDMPTLASVLALYGYRTGFFTAQLTGAHRLAAGFQTASHHDEWAETQKAATDWWAVDSAQPRLMVVVLSDAEGPVLRSSALPRFPERKYQWLEPLDPRIGKLKLDAASIHQAYADAAATSGAALGALLADLGGDRPRWTLVGSSNGMSLTERGGFTESPVPLLTNNLLVDRAIRVPLVLSGPAVGVGLEDTVVELVDVLPTIAKLAGAVAPAGISGTDLLGQADGPAYAEFGDMLWYRSGQHALTFRCTQHNATSIDPGVTAVLTDPKSSRPAAFYSMYNVAEDPMQNTNLRAQQPDLFEQLRSALVGVRTGEAAVPDDTITPERLWALRMAPSDGYW
jgi:arylsulfatase A-like enzyme